MTSQPTSPFSPVDLPDMNNIPTASAMPPMGISSANVGQTADAGAFNIPTAAPTMEMSTQPEMPQQSAMPETGAQPEQPEMPTQLGTTEMPKSEMQNGASNQAGAGATAEVANMEIPEPALKPEGKSELEKETEKIKTEAKPAKLVTKATTAPNTVKAMKAGAETTKPAIDSATVSQVEVAASSLPNTAAAPGGLTIEPLLEECIRHNASDLHLQVGLPPVLRIDGTLRPITTYPVLDDMQVQQLVFSTLDANQKVILIKDKEFDYSFAFGDLGRFRVNAFHEKGNMAAAFRLIPNEIKSIDDLGLPGVVSTFADHPNGLVLVTGPTGSGKSTTLAALIDKVNTEKALHIITIEDPIEFTHESKRSLVAQREVHYDTYSFAAALRSILREDPDVVLIGEMRDLETIQAAITVAETGHLVFATLHTNSAAQSIDRMVDVFPAHQQPQIRAQLANILVGICSQRLVPAIDGGRIAVTEIMVTNSAVRSIIREGKTHQLDMTIQTGMSQGMQTMDRELAKYVKSGTIAYDVARGYAVDPAEFDRLARG